MRFIEHAEGASADQLSIAEMPKPGVRDHQVLVKVTAFGVNRADILQRQGKYPPPAGESPVLGLEVAGQVEAVGKQVSRWQAGDKVFGLVAGGGYAEYVSTDADHLLPVPDGMSMVDAGGIAEVFLTAYQSLFRLGQLKPGQHVLIHAGASGVGLAAIQLAKYQGATVAVTASSQAKLDVCAHFGADTLINYQTEDFAKVIKAGNRGVDLIIDFVAGDYLNRNLKLLNLDGRLIYLAMLAGRYADPLDMALLLGKRATILGSTLRNRSARYKAELTESFAKQCLAGFSGGELRPVTDQILSYRDIQQAHQQLEANQTKGKLVCTWQEV